MTDKDDLSILREKPFADAVKKFEELVVQNGRAFLLGAGCSKCAGLPLTAELTNQAIGSSILSADSKAILGEIQQLYAGAANSHIEDYLSELVDLLAIADRRTARGATQVELTVGTHSYSAGQLRIAADQIKRAISDAIAKDVSIDVHRAFVAAVQRPVRVGRSVSSLIVDYLVLNYDTLVENALALERIPYSDGIDGGVTGWWNDSTFDREGLAARVFKLHGSVNWCEVEGETLPRRIAPGLSVQAMSDRRVLIWPASTKYRESQLDPFAQLAERARRVMRPSRGSQRVLVTCGYSFGDAHINIEVERALRDSAGDLTVVAFSGEDSPTGKLKEWHETAEIRDQLLVLAKRGFFHGDAVVRTEHELPWWKFENVVRLLGGER